MEDFENQNVSEEIEHNAESQQPTAAEVTAEPVADLREEMEEVREVPVERFHEQPAAEPVQSRQEPTAYRGIGTGRKESPYANSPYVMNHQPRQEQTDPHTYQPRNDYTQREPRRSDPVYQPRYEAPKKPKAKKKKGGFWKKALSGVAALALVIGSCAITANLVNDQWEQRTAQMEQSFSSQLEDLQQQIEALSPENTGVSVSGSISMSDMAAGYSAGQVYAQNVQSVVLIQSTVTATMYGQTATGISAGSGFILTEDGYVVTNYHVVEGANAVSVITVDGTEHPAQLVGYDATNDVAVLKIEATGLKAVTLGSSSDLIVGDMVVAIGNPLGELTSTLTVGYVSAKERDVSTDGTIINMIQTDAAINSGNSGGPLFNMRGEVIGITTAKYSGSSSSGASIEGIGFAIPMDDVLKIIEDLMEFGYVKGAYMGVVVQNMDTEIASIYGLPVGAYVVSVEEGGSAHRAGIQAKDIIMSVEDFQVETITDLTRALREYEPGDIVSVSIYRGGRVMNLRVTLDERPQNVETVVPETETEPEQTMPEGNWYDYIAPFFGNGNSNGG